MNVLILPYSFHISEYQPTICDIARHMESGKDQAQSQRGIILRWIFINYMQMLPHYFAVLVQIQHASPLLGLLHTTQMMKKGGKSNRANKRTNKLMDITIQKKTKNE